MPKGKQNNETFKLSEYNISTQRSAYIATGKIVDDNLRVFCDHDDSDAFLLF